MVGNEKDKEEAWLKKERSIFRGWPMPQIRKGEGSNKAHHAGKARSNLFFDIP
jgi:hypothetical protein